MTRASLRRRSMTPRQVDGLLGAAVTGCLLTGVTSWAVGSGWVRWWTAAHAIFGLAILVLTPAKISGSVRTGMRRNPSTRALSVLFGVIVVTTVALGLAHSTGAWVGVGLWSPLWTHVLLGFVATLLLLWHIASRPVRMREVSLDRRLFIGAAAAAAVAGAGVATLEIGGRALGTRGADRRGTGSHEIGSYDPASMPSVSWIDDRAPRVDAADWSLTVAGNQITIAALAAATSPLDAAVDCTGGWFSRQRWDVVPIVDLVPAGRRSFRVTSATGYSRIFPMRDADRVFLATGYDGRPLRRGHGAPVRLVAPNRRGPWWVKWVRHVEPTDRPWWLQLPFPPT